MKELKDISDILQGAAQGEVAAEKKLYQICFEYCFKVARLYSHDVEEATATFNYAMLDVFKSLRSIESYDHLLKITSTIVKRDCIDNQRKRTVYQNKLNVVAERISGQDVFNMAISKLTMDEILALIANLDSNYRLCFNLHAIEGYKYKEIAQTLHININTAKWYVREARKKLQETIYDRNSYLKKGSYGS